MDRIAELLRTSTVPELIAAMRERSLLVHEPRVVDHIVSHVTSMPRNEFLALSRSARGLAITTEWLPPVCLAHQLSADDFLTCFAHLPRRELSRIAVIQSVVRAWIQKRPDHLTTLFADLLQSGSSDTPHARSDFARRFVATHLRNALESHHITLGHDEGITRLLEQVNFEDDRVFLDGLSSLSRSLARGDTELDTGLAAAARLVIPPFRVKMRKAHERPVIDFVEFVSRERSIALPMVQAIWARATTSHERMTLLTHGGLLTGPWMFDSTWINQALEAIAEVTTYDVVYEHHQLRAFVWNAALVADPNRWARAAWAIVPTLHGDSEKAMRSDEERGFLSSITGFAAARPHAWSPEIAALFATSQSTAVRSWVMTHMDAFAMGPERDASLESATQRLEPSNIPGPALRAPSQLPEGNIVRGNGVIRTA